MQRIMGRYLNASQGARLGHWRRRCAGMTLMELTAAMIILLAIIGVTLFSSVSLERSAALVDAQYALGDEVARQSELVKAMPMAQLAVLTPIPGSTGIGQSIPYTSTNVAPLNGFVVNLRDAAGNQVAIRPTVKWIRTRKQLFVGSSDLGNTYDEVLVSATTPRAGQTLTNWTIVTRLFDSSQ